MDFGKDELKISKLNDDNFHVWKSRILLVLALKELDQFIVDNPPPASSDGYQKWQKSDNKAKAIIGLNLSDSHLEQVEHAKTAKDLWWMITEIFEKHTLMNKLSARRRFYTAVMREDENVLEFASRIRQLAGSLKSMGVSIDDPEMAMALLNGLPDRFDGLISALDALGTEGDKFSFEFVKGRCHQAEQRHLKRDEDTRIKTETAALIATRNKEKELCVHCGKHYNSNCCYKKFPHLAPSGFRKKENKALCGKQYSEKEEELCLLGISKTDAICKNHATVCLSAYESAFPEGSFHWFIDYIQP